MYLQNLDHILNSLEGKRVAVIGDLMLDRYIWGSVNRISPEAPVPVVSVERTTHCLGGSANVVHNLKSLGAHVLPVGVTGQDADGEILRALFEESGIDTELIFRDTFRPTTIKTRVIAHDQHVVRVDAERSDPLGDQLCRTLVEALLERSPELDALIFQDYDKGVLQPKLIQELREHCIHNGIFTAVDPKFRHFEAYGAVDLFKPNEKELCDATGRQPTSEEELDELGMAFRERSGCKELVVTRGGRGMVCYGEEAPIRVPALRHSIVDVSGAGDTVISALVLARLGGSAMGDALKFASLAAACACGEVGAVPVSPSQLQLLNSRLDEGLTV